MDSKRYLGDGIYADVDATGNALILTTENGMSETNRIEIDQERWQEIMHFVVNVWANFESQEPH